MRRRRRCRLGLSGIKTIISEPIGIVEANCCCCRGSMQGQLGNGGIPPGRHTRGAEGQVVAGNVVSAVVVVVTPAVVVVVLLVVVVVVLVLLLLVELVVVVVVIGGKGGVG